MSGGAIVPGKSWIYPISFKFDDQGNWSYMNLEEINYNFTIKDQHEDTKNLTQKEPQDGKETLGVILAPDGNNLKMIDKLRSKSEKWKDLITSGHITKTNAYQVLNTTILKSLEYPMPALTLTKKQCTYIMAPALTAGLAKSGVSSRFPREAVYGPKGTGGLGISSIYTVQGTSRIAKLQEHLAATTMTGELLRSAIEILKLEIGTGNDIFSLNYEKYEALATDSWIKDVWRYAYENKIRIFDDTTANLTLQRDSDSFIMSSIVQLGFNKTDLQHINKCRMHL